MKKTEDMASACFHTKADVVQWIDANGHKWRAKLLSLRYEVLEQIATILGVPRKSAQGQRMPKDQLGELVCQKAAEERSTQTKRGRPQSSERVPSPTKKPCRHIGVTSTVAKQSLAGDGDVASQAVIATPEPAKKPMTLRAAQALATVAKQSLAGDGDVASQAVIATPEPAKKPMTLRAAEALATSMRYAR